MDSNDQTSGGRGSVDFSVSISGEEKFRSGVIREGMAGQPVKVDLGGVKEFVLQVEETSDGISCDQADWAEAKAILEDGREVWLADLPLKEATERRLYYGDFHPLTPWSRDDQTWMAWQFNRPEAGEGMVQAFRRHGSFYEAARFKLRELEADATYRITHLDTADSKEMAGRELMDKGLPVTLSETPSAAVIVYQRAK